MANATAILALPRAQTSAEPTVCRVNREIDYLLEARETEEVKTVEFPCEELMVLCGMRNEIMEMLAKSRRGVEVIRLDYTPLAGE